MWIINKILKLFGKNRDEEDLEFTHVKLPTLLISKDGKVLEYGKNEEEIELKLKQKEKGM